MLFSFLFRCTHYEGDLFFLSIGEKFSSKARGTPALGGVGPVAQLGGPRENTQNWRGDAQILPGVGSDEGS
jgi:hypothetical protein